MTKNDNFDHRYKNQPKLIAQAKDQAELDQERVRIYSSMESALEGAAESIGKFNQSFTLQRWI